MRADLENFNTGWFGLSLSLKEKEIDELIEALKNLKESNGHFHMRGDFSGDGGIGEIELSIQPDSEESNLELDCSTAKYPKQNT